jgi:hypothetical protein
LDTAPQHQVKAYARVAFTLQESAACCLLVTPSQPDDTRQIEALNFRMIFTYNIGQLETAAILLLFRTADVSTCKKTVTRTISG